MFPSMVQTARWYTLFPLFFHIFRTLMQTGQNVLPKSWNTEKTQVQQEMMDNFGKNLPDLMLEI